MHTYNGGGTQQKFGERNVVSSMAATGGGPSRKLKKIT